VKTQERIDELDILYARISLGNMRRKDEDVILPLIGREVKRLKKLVAVNEASKRKRLQNKLIDVGAVTPRPTHPGTDGQEGPVA
jgi:hypothetical protein